MNFTMTFSALMPLAFKKKKKNIEMNDVVSDTEMFLDKDKTYYILCQSGNRSSMVCNNLSKRGYNVINIAGGMNAY